MTALVNIIAWLSAAPHIARLWLATRNIVRLLVRILVDDEAGRARDLPPGMAPIIDHNLQLAEACLARLIWLRAMQIANLRARPVARPFAYHPPRRLRSHSGFALHALDLLDRFARSERLARRLAARIKDQVDSPTGNPVIAHPPDNPATITGHILSQRAATLTTLILRPRAARGLEGWTKAPSPIPLTQITATGPPTRRIPESTHQPHSAIIRFRSYRRMAKRMRRLSLLRTHRAPPYRTHGRDHGTAVLDHRHHRRTVPGRPNIAGNGSARLDLLAQGQTQGRRWR